jgi:murein DD-endopeptidase MepM/ murein hydrolase activator NlpD
MAAKYPYPLFFLSFLFLLAAYESPPRECHKNCPPPLESTPPAYPAPNPALGWSVIETGTDSDPLAAFGRRPIDEPWIIPFGGDYQDPNRAGPHYGIDYTYPEKFLAGLPQPVYPIGPGVVTALHTCRTCWAQSTEPWGKLRTGEVTPVNNFGFGALVVIEHPYNEQVSFYSLYAHLREIEVVVGQKVDSETVLALLGGSGDVAAPHVHLEIRYGLPGQFWGGDFSNLSVMRRWLALDHETPVFLLYAEHHVPFTRVLERWALEEYPLLVPALTPTATPGP